MSEDNQILIPPSFTQLFMAPGRARPSETRAVIAARHELCEDMAGMLTEHALDKRFELGVTEGDVLERMHLGLLADGAGFSRAEAGWVVHRLAELLNWPQPVLAGEEPPA
jgi:hypothetical protein